MGLSRISALAGLASVATNVQFQRSSSTFVVASTGTKDPRFPDTFFVDALAAPFTINTMPDSTLSAFAAHGRILGTMNPHPHDALYE
jgi:transaldolase